MCPVTDGGTDDGAGRTLADGATDLPESAREDQACDCFIAGAEGWPHAANCASVSPAVEESDGEPSALMESWKARGRELNEIYAAVVEVVCAPGFGSAADDIRALGAERNRLRAEVERQGEHITELDAMLVASEAKVERLRAALTRIADVDPNGLPSFGWLAMSSIAHAALAGSPSQETK
jgi:hypothetical protein